MVIVRTVFGWVNKGTEWLVDQISWKPVDPASVPVQSLPSPTSVYLTLAGAVMYGLWLVVHLIAGSTLQTFVEDIALRQESIDLGVPVLFGLSLTVNSYIVGLITYSYIVQQGWAFRAGGSLVCIVGVLCVVLFFGASILSQQVLYADWQLVSIAAGYVVASIITTVVLLRQIVIDITA